MNSEFPERETDAPNKTGALNKTDALKLRELFNAAWEMEALSRASFLDQNCAGRPDLRNAMERLLSADFVAESATLWQRPAVDAEAREMAADASLPFENLGPYRIIGRIGAGGMGTVYLAWRDYDDVRRQVAIKVVPRALLDDEMIRRFRQERQILARLEHPNIARMLDAGRTPEGMPYLVMEHVDGVPLDRYTASRSLSVAARLALFRAVCDAVAYAHRNLIVHRDLKPGNILVTADGVVKLLDFGIARLLSETSNPDATSAAMMTPRYASPEQLAGAPVTTASDVYSLGVILRELLAGQKLNEDIRTVLAMALRQDPDRRYGSAGDLAEDARRALEGYPVRARPDTLAYRARRFVSRRKREVAVVTAMAAALALAGVVAWKQYLSASQRFAEVRGIANSFLFEVNDALADVPGTTQARMIVARRAQQYLDVLAQDRSSDLALRRELATSYRRLGDILGQPFQPNLGDTSGALANYGKAAAALEGIAASGSPDAALLTDLGKIYSKEGQILLRRGSTDEAVATGRKSMALMARAAALQPLSRQARYELSNSRLFLSLAELELGRARNDIAPLRTSEALAADARAATLQLSVEDPGNERFQVISERACSYLAYAELDIAPRSGDASYAARAVRHHEEQLEIVERLYSGNPGRYRRTLADSFADLSRAWLAAGDPVRSDGAARESLRGFEQIAAGDPHNVEAVRDVMVARWCLAKALAAQRRDKEAASEFAGVLTAYEQLHRQDPADQGYTIMVIVAESRDGLAAYRMATGMRAVAIALYGQNIRNLEGSALVSEMVTVALDYGRIGDATASVDPAQSQASYRQAVILWEKLRDSHRLPAAYVDKPAELRRAAFR